MFNSKIFVDIPSYPCEFFVLSDFVMSSVSLDDTPLRLIVGNGRLNALDRYVIGCSLLDGGLHCNYLHVYFEQLMQNMC